MFRNLKCINKNIISKCCYARDSGNNAQYNIQNIKILVTTANNQNKMIFHTYAPVNSMLGMMHMS